MSKILRHGAIEKGLVMNEAGYVQVQDLLALPEFKHLTATEEDIRQAVANCDKQRFRLQEAESVLMVRANQGHTINGVLDEHELLEELTEESVSELTGGTGIVYHGTYRDVLHLIRRDGLCRMARNHIHMATAYDGSVKSGMRGSCEVVVPVNVLKAMRAGLVFFRSSNGVILCAGQEEKGFLPSEFFEEIIELDKGSKVKGKEASESSAACEADESESES